MIEFLGWDNFVVGIVKNRWNFVGLVVAFLLGFFLGRRGWAKPRQADKMSQKAMMACVVVAARGGPAFGCLAFDYQSGDFSI